MNPQYLEKAYSLPLGWTDPQECRQATELLGIEGKPSEMHLTPEWERSPSVESSISIPSQKPLTLKACEKELEPLGFGINVKRRGRNKGVKRLYWSSDGNNYHQIFKPETPYEVIRDYALSVLGEIPKLSSDESCPLHPNHLTNSPENVMENFSPESLPIAQIRRDGGTQPRAAINHLTITEYAQDMKEGDRFPAVLVFYDGTDYWLADGFHRVLAAESLGMAEMPVEIRQGTRRDAILYSVGANAKHGLRRTNTDKRRVVTTLLEDEEWSQWSDREIARHCKVDHKTVGKIRANLTGDFPSNKTLQNLTEDSSGTERTYTTKYGNVSKMNTANIGRKSPGQTKFQPVDDGENSTESVFSEPHIQPLTVGSPVIVTGEHPRNGQIGQVTVLPNSDGAIVLFEDEQRELIRLEFLSPATIDDSNRMTKVTDTPHAVQIKEGLNYRAGNGCEWYVRVEQSTWERLLDYQAHVGTATLDSAIKRLLEMVGVRENTGL